MNHETWLEYRKFQSTLPRRERPQHQKEIFVQIYFNPRSREGSDLAEVENADEIAISIHAPAKGATTSR